MKKTNLLQTMYQVSLFALPLSAGSIMNALSGFISMMMVAQFGETQLAAGSLALTTFITIMTLTATIFYSVGILISHYRGQNKTASDIGLIVKNGFWVAIILAIPSGLALWYADQILLLFGQEPKLVALTRGYFHFAAIGILPLLIGTVMLQFFAGIGKPRFTLLISLISLPLTVAVAYGLILGHFGLPQFGLSGITFANLIVQTLMTAGILLMFYLRSNMKAYQIFHRPLLPQWSICKSIFSLGIPIGLQFGGEFVAITIATYLLGLFGVTALAAAQVTSQYYMLLIILFIGLTQALSLLVSGAYGKGDFYLIKSYLHAAIALLLLCCVFIAIAFCVFPKELIRFYVGDKIVDPHFEWLTSIFFAISACLLLIDGLRHLLSGALRGLHDSHGPMKIGVLSLWFVSLPIAYLVAFPLHGGPVGLRIGFLSGFVLAAVLLLRRMYKKLK